ncbi:MAG: hypothetical protein ACRDPY_40540, partial [Streptosporangiaceae bacterium]
MTVMSWIRFTIVLWLLRKAVKGFGWLLLVLLAVAFWPVTIVTVLGYVAAWLRGWPASRLRRAAAACLPGTILYLAAQGRRYSWPAVPLATARDWGYGWQHLGAVEAARTFVLLAPVAVPAGLVLASWLWAWRVYAITAGLGGRLASAPVTFDARQWRRQVRAAKGRIAAPGAAPLLARGGRIPVGGTIRAVGCKWRPVFTLPYGACGRHMVIIGSTGSGKTNLMIRLWAGWY